MWVLFIFNISLWSYITIFVFFYLLYNIFTIRSINMNLTDDMLREALIKVATEEIEALEEKIKDSPPIEFSEDYLNNIKRMLNKEV